jgi:uncharacterized protein YlaI
VECSRCHKLELINGTKVVRYKPIRFECQDCHDK